MPPSDRKHAVFRMAGFGVRPVFALIFGVLASLATVDAQLPLTITNLAQMTRLLGQENPIVAEVRLDATVFACSTNAGVLILQDATGTGALELAGCRSEFRAGDWVRIEGGPWVLRPGDFGTWITSVPLLNNDGIHSPQTVSCGRFFAAGRYPLQLDWFNQFAAFRLDVSCETTNPGEKSSPVEKMELLHATHAECFQGLWSSLPDFQLLRPVKTGTVTNFDVGFRSRDEMVGIRFEGYFDAPQAGTYLFHLTSDDGSRLWVGNAAVPVKKLGTNAPPPAPPAMIGESMSTPDEHRLATIEGRVSFVASRGQGLGFELRAGRETVSVQMADAGALKPADLLNACVRVSGLAGGVLTENQRLVLGRLWVASSQTLTILENPPGKGTQPPVLTTVMQVHSLSDDDALRHLPVTIRGVVTAVSQPIERWMAIQDDTRGSFVRLVDVTNCLPAVGEVWRIAGYTQPGDFAPIIVAEKAELLGPGRLPEPAHVGWNQLVNGSMDVQWVELQGLVTGVWSNNLSLLLPEGRLEVSLPAWGETELKAFDKAVVRIRGTLFATWNAWTHEVHSGNIVMCNASFAIDKPAPADPFAAPEKTPRGLFLFDAKATPFQRVKVRGQVTYADAKRLFLEQGSGIQVFPAAGVKLQAGDWVEAVGFPGISGASPLLREALVRKTGAGVLSNATLVSDLEIAPERLASARIRIEGQLAGQHLEGDTLVLQMQTRSHLFPARVAHAGSLPPWRPGSKLLLTGVYVPESHDGKPSNGILQFELLLNGSGDVVVLSAPSWWTLQRLLSVVGVLMVTLALAAVWITLLRRQVAQRTLQLQHEIRERERAERQRALETERSRIARDLHDDLGSSLTEINVLASTGQRPRSGDHTHPALFKAIADKARALVAALDVIVWAVDPEDNSLQSLADYLSGYTREFLSHSDLTCRFKIPITFPPATLDGQIRHEVLMVVKESLNNIVRHADATEVEFQMNLADGILEITIADNGKGFDPNAETFGHGLKNRSVRLADVGGSCLLESGAGLGTTVRIRLPIGTAKTGQEQA